MGSRLDVRSIRDDLNSLKKQRTISFKIKKIEFNGLCNIQVRFPNRSTRSRRVFLCFFFFLLFFFVCFLQPNSRKRKRKLRARRQISNASPNWRRPSISVGSPDWRVGRSKSTNDFFYWPSSFSSPAHLLVGTALFRV